MISWLRSVLPHAPEQDSPALAGPSVEVGPRRLRIDDTYSQTLIVTGYPREVAPGWATALMSYPGRLDVALHIDPVDSGVASTQLRKRRARLESSWRLDAHEGRVEDPQRAAAVEDAADLAQRVATAQARLFRLALYVTVHASTEAELAAEVEHVRTLASSMMLDTVPATFRALQGWIATLPLGTDPVRVRRTMDTDAVATMVPFASPDLVADVSGGTPVLYGTNLHSAGLVVWDRFFGELDNHNSVILARSGAGKSYLAKLEILRLLVVGVEVAVIDPDDEYARLAYAVGGTRIALGTPHGRINPFDLPAGDPQALTNRALWLHTLIATMIGDLSAEEAAVLDRAILATYAAAGITTDERTWHRQAPQLADLAETLVASDDDAAPSLVARLRPYVHGSHAALFDGPSANLTGHLTVISLRQLPDELKSVGVLLALDALWRRVTTPDDRRPRMITVDEAWVLLQSPVGARYLYRLAKGLRKHWAGLTVITQDVGDVLSTDLGRAVVSNAATQILLTQGPQNLDAVASAFTLSDGERHVVATAQRGDALLLSGHHRVAFHGLASPAEDRLITTDPAELLDDTEEDLGR